MIDVDEIEKPFNLRFIFILSLLATISLIQYAVLSQPLPSIPTRLLGNEIKKKTLSALMLHACGFFLMYFYRAGFGAYQRNIFLPL